MLRFLIVNGGWSSWGAFEACSKTCGGGEKTQRRMCNNPAPARGGSYCPGTNINTVLCNTQHCPGNIYYENSIYRISLLHEKRKHSFHILKVLFSFDTRQSMAYHTLTSVGREQYFQYVKRMFPLLRAIVKFCSTNR